MKMRMVKVMCAALAAANLVTVMPVMANASIPDISMSVSSTTRLHNTWVNKGVYRYYYAFNKPVKGFKTIDGKTYYFSENTGAMQKGWKTINEKRYYFNSDGSMATGNVTINGTNYTFSADGSLSGKQKYTVTFKDGLTGKVLSTQTIESGKSAKAPDKPVHSGYRFVTWKGSYIVVKENKTITAVYQKVAANKTTAESSKKISTSIKTKATKTTSKAKSKTDGKFKTYDKKTVYYRKSGKDKILCTKAGKKKGILLGVPLYNQKGPSCGPTSLAMAFSYLKNKKYDGSDLYNKLGHGNTGFSRFANSVGYKMSVKGASSITDKAIKKSLDAKRPVIISFGGASNFSSSAGHFSVIVGYYGNRYFLNDPNSCRQYTRRKNALFSLREFKSGKGNGWYFFSKKK